MTLIHLVDMFMLYPCKAKGEEQTQISNNVHDVGEFLFFFYFGFVECGRSEPCVPMCHEEDIRKKNYRRSHRRVQNLVPSFTWLTWLGVLTVKEVIHCFVLLGISFLNCPVTARSLGAEPRLFTIPSPNALGGGGGGGSSYVFMYVNTQQRRRRIQCLNYGEWQMYTLCIICLDLFLREK